MFIGILAYFDRGPIIPIFKRIEFNLFLVQKIKMKENNIFK